MGSIFEVVPYRKARVKMLAFSYRDFGMACPIIALDGESDLLKVGYEGAVRPFTVLQFLMAILDLVVFVDIGALC